MTALNIRSWADVRALAYVLLPILSTLLVSYGVLDDAHAALWSGLATAVLGPVIAFAMARSLSSFRTAFYALLAAAQAVLIGYGLLTSEQIGLWVPLISALVGAASGGVAAANTPVSSSFTGNAQGEADPNAPVAE